LGLFADNRQLKTDNRSGAFWPLCGQNRAFRSKSSAPLCAASGLSAAIPCAGNQGTAGGQGTRHVRDCFLKSEIRLSPASSNFGCFLTTGNCSTFFFSNNYKIKRSLTISLRLIKMLL
jgi:hypothetical protein